MAYTAASRNNPAPGGSRAPSDRHRRRPHVPATRQPAGHPLPGPAHRTAGPALRLQAGQRGDRAHRHRIPLGRGSGVFPRRRLPGVQRHPEQPHAALAGGGRAPLRFPRAVELRQRQHPGPRGAADHLRARYAACHAHRTRWPHHRADRPLRRQTVERAERRGGGERRGGMVHRPWLRHRRPVRGPQGGSRIAAQRLSIRPRDRHRCGGRR